MRHGETGWEGDGTTEKDGVAMNAITRIFYAVYWHFLLYMSCIIGGSYSSKVTD